MSPSILLPLGSVTLSLGHSGENPRDSSRGKDLATIMKSAKSLPQYLTSLLLSPVNTVFCPSP